MCGMAKKTGMSDSSLWVVAILLVAVAVWTYFKR
jgi:LPXTG-motif cell wall-anchored protein